MLAAFIPKTAHYSRHGICLLHRFTFLCCREIWCDMTRLIPPPMIISLQAFWSIRTSLFFSFFILHPRDHIRHLLLSVNTPAQIGLSQNWLSKTSQLANCNFRHWRSMSHMRRSYPSRLIKADVGYAFITDLPSSVVERLALTWAIPPPMIISLQAFWSIRTHLFLNSFSQLTTFSSFIHETTSDNFFGL